MDSVIKAQIEEHSELIRLLHHDILLYDKIRDAVGMITAAFRNDKKVLLCGNGGSSSDAEHIAAELSGKFKMNRRPLYAEALHVNTAAMTAISNDFGYDKSFSRIVEAKGRKGDILMAYSTSGASPNVLSAIEMASQLGCHVISFCGIEQERMRKKSEIIISIPHKDTARVQEAHMLISHIICDLVESILFKKDKDEEGED